MLPPQVIAASSRPDDASTLMFPPPGALDGTTFSSGAAGVNLPDELARDAAMSGDNSHKYSNFQYQLLISLCLHQIGENISTAGILFRNLEDFISTIDPALRSAGL